ncbi:hypothetical protein AB1Y20_021610 [Prymnesium parvum]|uniref:Rhodanese domain-containing protein n=1 Tax=Prymnesium parvum TaxID=97485 RepID=A0AB34JMP6_PRYPA
MAVRAKGREEAAALLQKHTALFADIPLASASEVLRLRAAATPLHPFFLIDVRTAEERAVSMIPGAISAAAFERLCDEQPETVARGICVPYCTIGFRSGVYCRRLQHASVPPAKVLNGEGVVLWSHDVGAFEGGTRRVHCYGKEWEVAAEGFETVVFNQTQQLAKLPALVSSIVAWLRSWLCPCVKGS